MNQKVRTLTKPLNMIFNVKVIKNNITNNPRRIHLIKGSRAPKMMNPRIRMRLRITLSITEIKR
jgi:hypothetical protein